MSDDLAQTERQGDSSSQRALDWSLRQRPAPAQVPGYEVQKCLGEGAFGEVWLAKAQNTGRQVAIKFYTRRSGDWALLAREVEKLNYLATDRYVVQLVEVGWNAVPPFYVMEFMENGSLADRLKAGAVPVREAVELFREIAVGVVNAHNRGVLHCDLKPANVLLGLDGKPRLADFGQSRLSHERAPALGTLFYMAPEQADLKAAPDTRWDVYALGAVLYDMLTGGPPYRGAAADSGLERSGSLEERLAAYRKLLKESPQPSDHQRVPGMDRPLSDIIRRCLSVDPAKRYPNVQAVLNALDARALRRARRPLLVFGAVGPAVLLLLMGGLIRSELGMAVDTATEALTQETKVSNTFAAQAVAAKVGVKVERRWRALEQEAAKKTFKSLLKSATGKGLGTAEQTALQHRLDQMKRDHPEASANSWSVFDGRGTLLARAPRIQETDRYVGQRFWHRAFFHGGKKDLDPAADTPPPPLDHFYISPCFVSRLTNARMVTFSVPVWENKTEPPGGPRLGVLFMSVEVGGFAELKTEAGVSTDILAVLIDLHEDGDGKKGAILEHPGMAELRRRNVPQRDWKFYLTQGPLYSGSWDPNYHDPFGQQDETYAGRWLATSQPVQIEPRPGETAPEIHWVAVIQERYDTAIGPVKALESDMTAQGRWALIMAVSVVTALWAFVIVVLNESRGSRLFRFIRRSAGLPGDSIPSMKALSGSGRSD